MCANVAVKTDLRAEVFSFDVVNAALAMMDYFSINEEEWLRQGYISSIWADQGTATVRYEILGLAAEVCSLYDSWPDALRCDAKRYSFVAEFLEEAVDAFFIRAMRGVELAAALTAWADAFDAEAN